MKKHLIKKNFIFFTLLIILALPFKLFPEQRITVVYTNSLNGYLDDCRCKDNPRGGLVMRATEIKKIRASYKNVFLFETGDFFAPESDDLIAKYLIKGYKYIGYDSISIGDQEFSGGIDTFLKYYQELPFICNNIVIQTKGTQKLSIQRFQIISKDDITIGIIGTISEHAFKYYPEKILKQIKVLDQVREINKDIDTLKSKGIEHIFLLSHSGYDRDKELAKKINGLDLIIGGHSQTLLKKPVKIGNTIIVQAGADGARIGVLELTFSSSKVNIINNSFKLPHLPNFKEDSFIRKLINEYNDEVKKDYKKLRFD